MPLVFRYSDPGGAEEPAVTVDLGNTITTVRLGTLALSQAAELGDVAMSGIEIEDPDGTLDLVGLRGFRVEETSAPSNSRWIFNGPIGDQRIKRGDSQRPSIRLGASRVWSIDLSDQNWSLGVSIITGSDGNRPAETAGERLRWVIRQYSRVKDYGHVTYPTDAMDACDYRHQTVKDVIADCALPGGYNYWVDRFEAQNHPELFFMLPTSSDYASAITISNVYADVDSVTVFAPAIEAELVRSPSRITYGVDLQYDGGSVYVTNSTTGNQFAFVDQSAPMANVKSSAKATVIANRFLSENDEQDERVTCSILVPAAQVNDVRHGHRVNGVTFQHLPGWYQRDCRVLRRTVAQEEAGGEAWYRIDLELTPISPAQDAPWVCPLDAGISGTEAGFYGPLGGTTTDSRGNIWYTNSNHAFFGDGHTFTDGPYPNQTCYGLGFPVYATGGGDGGGPHVNNVIAFVFAGEGAIDWGVTYYGGNGCTWAVEQWYVTATGAVLEQSDTAAATDSGTMTVGPLPADASSCYRYFLMKIGARVDDPGGATTYGVFPGLTWTPA